MKKVQVLLLATSLLLLSGCATIMRTAGEGEITIESNPSGARFIISNDLGGRVLVTGTTPQTIQLGLLNWKKDFGNQVVAYHLEQQSASDKFVSIFLSEPGFTLLVEKEGYAPKVIPLEPSVSNWYTYGNCCAFPCAPIGCIAVDPLTGAMWVFPEKINVNLSQ